MKKRGQDTRMEIIVCACGCGRELNKYDGHYRTRTRVLGHGTKGRLLPHIWIPNPSIKLSRARARKIRTEKVCDISNNFCLGRIESAHIDHNPLNNEIENIARLCKAHHSVMDFNRLKISDLYSWVRKGKRRK